MIDWVSAGSWVMLKIGEKTAVKDPPTNNIYEIEEDIILEFYTFKLTFRSKSC